jgi:GT2 family glycosyltransferase
MLSIVIPTHHRADLLELCLASVSSYAPRGTEVIVVDDASRGPVLRRVVAKFAQVRYLRLQRRSGFAVAANTGIRACQGDVVELLNDDTEVQAGWAEHAVSWFKQGDVAAVAPLVLSWPDGRRIDSAGDRYYVGGIAGKRGHGESPSAVHANARPVFGASASSAFYRRSALEKVGLFPESFGSYFEDVDLSFRLQRAGFRTMFEPRSQVLHRGSASFGRSGRKLLEQQSRNEERVFWRNMPRLWAALPRHVAVLLGKAQRRWQEGSLTPFLMGRLRVLGEVASIWRHRRTLNELGPRRDAGACHVDERYQ